MVLVRALGWLLMGVSVALAVRDALTWWSEGAFHPQSLGELWLQLDFASLKSLEALVSRHLSVMAWSRLMAPLLRLPALPVFVIVGLLLLWLGRRREEGSETAFFLNARRPRRRRRGGGL